MSRTQEALQRSRRVEKPRGFKLGDILLALAFWLVLGDGAWAWGPTTHIGIANTVLRELGLLPAGVALVLSRHALAFLYGSIAADVVFAKRWSRVKQFCHHWSTGFALLRACRGEREKSFAFGYLAHLAADTVAHGKFVPRQIALSDGSVNFGHLYWELRADALEPLATRRLLETVLAGDHAEQDRQLSRHITDTLLPFDVNRLLFERFNGLLLRERFRLTVRLCGRLSKWPLPADLLREYRRESADRVLSVLSEGEHSPVLREDPNGSSALMKLRVNRKTLRARLGRTASSRRRLLESSWSWAPGPHPSLGCSGLPLGPFTAVAADSGSALGSAWKAPARNAP
jgi:hypothetical protein